MKNDYDLEKFRKGRQKSEQKKRRKALQKRFRRNQQSRPPRKRDWIPAAPDEAYLDDEAYGAIERIMPRDELERRRALENAVAAVDQGDLDQMPVDVATDSGGDDNLAEGLVVAHGSGVYRVAADGGETLCTIRGALEDQESGFTNPAAVGDRVVYRATANGSGVIERVLPRRSLLSRPDVFHAHLRQIVVANVDQVVIIASWREPAIWFELLDRYLIAARRSDLPAVICVNKVDLAGDYAECTRAMAAYRQQDIPCLFTSATAGTGIEGLRATLAGQSSVLAGLSGVGKSSLLSAVQPGLDLLTGTVSARKHEGRHTTTQATLIALDETTNVVDTPGIREFGLAGLSRPELAHYFEEFTAPAAACRFRNCHHMDEPGCGVRSAVDAGAIAESRYHSYAKIWSALGA